MSLHPKIVLPIALAAVLLPFVLSSKAESLTGLDKRLLDAEEKRVAVIEKVKPSVVAVFCATRPAACKAAAPASSSARTATP